MNISSWLRSNWLVLILFLVIAVMFGKQNVTTYAPAMRGTGIAQDMMYNQSASKTIGMPVPYGEVAPVESDQRMVVQDTNMSMLVKDVSQTISGIEKIAVNNGGYMVNRSVVKPEGAASGDISLRVPVEKREESLTEIRALGVKVVSENVYGNDVTDEYVDLETRIASAEKVKAKLEAIQEQATQISDLMNAQQQINNVQIQIDRLKGQKNFLEQTAKLTRISIQLSTDELALPYAPDDAWRPGVVFKLAVRSMVGSLRSVVNAVIWGVVYLPIVALVVVLVCLCKKIYSRLSTT